MKLRQYLPAIIWWLISLVLFTLPGSGFHTEDWMDKLQLDKFVHIFIFFIWVSLFIYPIYLSHAIPVRKKTLNLLIICLLGLLYGVAVEFIQKFFVANRGFEGMDIVADLAGCIIAFAFWRNRIIKRG